MAILTLKAITKRLEAVIQGRRARSFDRGIDLPEHKHYTADKPTEAIPCPQTVVVPLNQHTGEPVEPIVSVGDRVTIGQKIGDLEEKWSSPVHAGVSGVVTHIEPRPFGDGTELPSVVIRADREQNVPELTPRGDWESLDRDRILAVIKDNGIVGMAGAGFPTHINLEVRTKIPTLIVNGAECEPFLTSDHRIMVERADAVIGGARIIARVIGADHCYIGIENNKPDAIEVLTERTRNLPEFSVVPVAVKYPQGYKKTLLRAITGKEPPLGGRSADVGCIVRNVSTTAAIYDAVVLNKPLFERVVTVSGLHEIARPGNYRVPIGTPLRHILEHVGVDLEALGGYKVVRGGPMTGTAVDTLEAPVVKAATGILVMPPAAIQPAYERVNPCIRCSACVKHCPIGLYPNEISQLVEAGTPEAAERLHISECCECAICSYVCPAYRQVTDLVMEGKAILKERRRRSR